MPFNYSLDFDSINFREHPELYRVGVGEQGVLLVQPYKGEILPYWRFKTPEIAKESSQKIYELFEKYLSNEDFVGADMARKFLQMGFTRARRYANHSSGTKYSTLALSESNKSVTIPQSKTKSKSNFKSESNIDYPYSSGSKNKGNEILPQDDNALSNQKALSANIFKEAWDRARNHPDYVKQKKEFIDKYGK